MVYTKRNLWFYNNGEEVFTFATEAEANAAYGVDNGYEEKEHYEEESSSDEQEAVLESEIGGEEEV